jgi:cyclase
MTGPGTTVPAVDALRLHDRDYRRGLHELADGVFAYLQPDGGWCLSNAGLVRAGSESLLVDTLTDLPRTRAMLDTMAPITDTAPIRRLAITHGNLDHYFGSQLVEGAEIIASGATATDIAEGPTPASMQAMLHTDLGAELNGFLRHAFGSFDWTGITVTPPHRTFEGRADLDVGGTPVVLSEVGPAHTHGDTICHLPEQRVVFTGDILFVHGTPIVWAGPFANWYRACDTLLALDADVYVPGHGPLTDRRGVQAVRAYLEFVHTEARRRFDAGMSSLDATFDIDLGEFGDLGDAERLAINVVAAYREFDPDADEPTELLELLRRMAALHSRARQRGRGGATTHPQNRMQP